MNTNRATFRLLLSACLLLAAALPLPAVNWQNVTIDLAGGLYSHDIGVVGGQINNYPFLVAVGSGGEMAFRLDQWVDLDRPVALYDFSASQGLNLGLLDGNSFAAEHAQWTNLTGSPIVFFYIDWSLREHAFVLVHPSGGYYPVQKLPLSSGAASAEGFEARAICTPGEEFWLVDLNTYLRAPSWETYLLSTPWTVESGPLPLIPVQVALDASQIGHRFTIHSRPAGGVDMPAAVTASADGTDARLAFSVGLGMEFWVTRELDNASTLTLSGGPWIATTVAAQWVDGSGVLWWWGGGSQTFPEPPQGNPADLEIHTFRINGETRAGHGFTVRMSDGYVALPYSNIAWGSDTISGWDDFGNARTLPLTIYTVVVDVTRAWWLHDDTTGEDFPVGQTEVLDGAAVLHDQPPPAYTITLRLPLWRSGHEFQLGSSQTFYAGGSSYESTTYPGLDGMAEFSIQGSTLEMADITSYSGGSFSLADITQGDSHGVSPGENDLRQWFGPAESRVLAISSSRWEHELLLRHPNGEAYPIVKNQTQGDLSFASTLAAWQSSYYYFDAEASYHPELPFYVEDASTGERLGPDPTNAELINWIALADPRHLAATEQTAGTFKLTWDFTETSTEGAFLLERRESESGPWQTLDTIPAATSLDTVAHHAHATAVIAASLPGKAVNVRVTYQYGGHRSAPSNTVALLPNQDTDGDGLPDWWERLWNLNPNDARDGNAWNPVAGTTAGDLYGQGATPGNGGPPPADQWTKRLSLWQIRETAGNILTWDGEIKPQTFVTIEREQAYGQWVTVRTVSASDRYALVTDSAQEDPLYHQHAQTGEGRSYQDAPNFRLRGGYPSNESVPRIRLMLRSGSVWRGQPGIREFEGPWFWTAGTTLARKYYKHAEWWGSSSANDGSSWSTKSGHFTYAPASNSESLTTDDYNTGDRQQSALGDSYPKPYPTGHAGSYYVTYTPDTFDQNVSKTSLWRRWYYRAGVPSDEKWGFWSGTATGGGTLDLPAEAPETGPRRRYESVTGTGPDESSWDWTLQLSAEYAAGEFNAASKALLPSAPDAEGTVIYQGAGRDAPQVTASYEQWPPLVEGSRVDVFGQDGGVWYLGISGTVTSQRSWSESLDNLGLSRSTGGWNATTACPAPRSP